MIYTVLLSILLPSLSHAACPSTSIQVRAEVDAAYANLLTPDLPAAMALLKVAEQDLTCLSEILPRDVLTRFYLVEAAVAYRTNDVTRTENALYALFVADPDYELDPAFAAADPQFPAFFATVHDRVTTPILTLEGHRIDALIPWKRLAFIQYAQPGQPLRSWLVEPEKPPGTYTDLEKALAIEAGYTCPPPPIAPAPPPCPPPPVCPDVKDPTPPPSDSRKPKKRNDIATTPPPLTPENTSTGSSDHKSRKMLSSAVIVGTAGGASLFVANYFRGYFFSTDSDQMASTSYAVNQATGVGGFTLELVAGGLGIASLVVWDW